MSSKYCCRRNSCCNYSRNNCCNYNNCGGGCGGYGGGCGFGGSWIFIIILLFFFGGGCGFGGYGGCF